MICRTFAELNSVASKASLKALRPWLLFNVQLKTESRTRR